MEIVDVVVKGLSVLPDLIRSFPKSSRKRLLEDTVTPLYQATDKIAVDYLNIFRSLRDGLVQSPRVADHKSAMRKFKADREMVIFARSKVISMLSDENIQVIHNKMGNSLLTNKFDDDVQEDLAEFARALETFFFGDPLWKVRGGGSRAAAMVERLEPLLAISDKKLESAMKKDRSSLVEALESHIRSMIAAWGEASEAYLKLRLKLS